MDVSPVLVADLQAPEAVEPGERPFDHPPVASQAVLGLDTTCASTHSLSVCSHLSPHGPTSPTPPARTSAAPARTTSPTPPGVACETPRCCRDPDAGCTPVPETLHPHTSPSRSCATTLAPCSSRRPTASPSSTDDKAAARAHHRARTSL